MDVAILSIAFDPQNEQAASKLEYGINAPMLVDADRSVSRTYDVLQWAVGTGEPGHTFILVDGELVRRDMQHKMIPFENQNNPFSLGEKVRMRDSIKHELSIMLPSPHPSPGGRGS